MSAGAFRRSFFWCWKWEACGPRMKQKKIRNVVTRALIAIVIAILFVSLLAERLFHPR
jgi:hypothetical protein